MSLPTNLMVCAPCDRKWGEYVFSGKAQAETSSLYQNQDFFAIPRHQHCLVRVFSNGGASICSGDGTNDCKLRFIIDGGSDFPRLRLDLHVKSPKDESTLVMTAIFLPWVADTNLMSRPIVEPRTEPPHQQTFSFSPRMTDLKWNGNPDVAESTRQKLRYVFASSEAVEITWDYCQPVCWGMKTSLVDAELPEAHSAALEAFKTIANGSKIQVLTRCTKKLIEAYNFFVSQPYPTLPHFHRHGIIVEPNSHAVHEIEPVEVNSGSALEMMFRRRIKGWPSYPPMFYSPPQVMPLTLCERFMDERHYEVFQAGIISRESQHEWYYAAKPTFNGKYFFDFEPFFGSTHVADRSYLIKLHLVARLSGALPPAPQPGSAVRLTKFNHGHSPDTEFLGRVIPSPASISEYDIYIVVTRVGGEPGFVLTDCEGKFYFGPQGGVPTRQAIAGIRRVMYGLDGVPPSNWLKQLLLAHDVPPLRFGNLPSTEQHARAFIQQVGLNQSQAAAFLQAIRLDAEALLSRLTIIQGPPGTGKTSVTVAILRYILTSFTYKVLVTAGSNTAIDVLAKKLVAACRNNNEPLDRIYRIKQDVFERIASDPEIRERDATDVLLADDRDLRKALGMTGLSGSLRSLDSIFEHTDHILRMSLESYLRTQLTTGQGESLSLVAHILKRLVHTKQQVESHPYDRRTAEEILLLELSELKQAMERWTPIETKGTELEQSNPTKNFDSKWLAVQKYYISQARVILVTAATSTTKACRVFAADVAVVEEASQVGEAEVVAALSQPLRHRKLKKAILVGDPKQLGATVISSLTSEFSQQAKLSLMERMMACGLHTCFLNTQYRMHPVIAATTSNNFYNGALTNHPSVQGRPDSVAFAQWSRDFSGTLTNSLMVAVSHDMEVFREVDGHSLINTKHLALIQHCVEGMIAKGIEGNKILVISFYAAQRHQIARLFKHLALPIRVSTVDGSQSDESAAVIVDLVNPGQGYGGGYIKDVRRTNVALSRAQDGLVIIASPEMVRGQEGTRGVEVWTRIIHSHQNRGALTAVSVNSGDVCRRLGLPGLGYSLAR